MGVTSSALQKRSNQAPSVQTASRPVVVHRVHATGEGEEDSHPSEQDPDVARAADGGAQNERSHHKSVADKVRRPNFVGQRARRFCLGKIEKIQIGCDANQHGLNEIQRHQGVEFPGFAVRVKEQGHGQGNEPETEQEVVRSTTRWKTR